ncbi:IscS subfamily cysteine desulfurase [Oceaniserpentilla sp. 4NH20-0058]|uniref:aminotransferase class V-fold PLP-dependent enzyme n=1 Tax=Oceaniserpentilla sp. 4NH20-0058 TaxID=3127660 RepID=UPI003104B466
MKPIYLDYAATTPVAPQVAEKMAACLTLEGNFANPASRSHRYGWMAEEAVENARNQLAQALHCDSREIVWTSGATEANNLAIKGVCEKLDGGHIITTAIEHKAVLDVCGYLETKGFTVTYLTPDSSGRISVAQVEQALQDDTCLVSVMYVNNELGVINPVADIAALCRSKKITFHVDGAQAVGKVDVNLERDGIDLLSISAHKFYGPKGMGALFVRRGVKVDAQIHGGGHERGMRSGTLPTHQIVGLGLAAEISVQELKEQEARLSALKQSLITGLSQVSGVTVNGENTVANIANVSFSGVDGESLLLSLHDLAVSSGSACNSATMAPSYVLKAIGLDDETAHASIRFSMGRFTTADEINQAVNSVVTVVQRLRAMTA